MSNQVRLSQAERLWRNQDLDLLSGMVVGIDRLRVRVYTGTAVTLYEPIGASLETARAELLKAEEAIRALAE